MQRKKFKVKINNYIFNQYHEAKNPKTEEQLTAYAIGQVTREGDRLFIPGHQIKGAMKRAVRLLDLKLGKSKAKGLDFINSVVFVEPCMIPVKLNGKPATMKDLKLIDQMTVVDGGGKRALKKTRHSMLPKAEIEFEVRIFADVLDMKYIEDALAGAQLVCNLGGLITRGYGKFEIL